MIPDELRKVGGLRLIRDFETAEATGYLSDVKCHKVLLVAEADQLTSLVDVGMSLSELLQRVDVGS